jgi:hypothetical protein
MQEMGLCGVLVYCADYRCAHSVAINADRWADELRLSDIELRFDALRTGTPRKAFFG